MNKVTSKQILYASAVCIIATSLLTKPLYTFTKNDSWAAVAAGFVAASVVFVVYAALSRRFSKFTLVEINDTVFGPVIGKIISALYVYFFFTLTCFDMDIIADFIKTVILPDTPVILILIVFILICAYAVRKGPVNLMKYSALLIYISVVIILFNTLLLINNSDLRRLLPLFSLKSENYLAGTHLVTLIPLCDPFILIMFLPDMIRPKEFGKALFKGLVIGAAFLLLIVIRDVSVMGEMISISAYPSHSSIRMIDVGDFLTRMDIVYISILIILMFYKVTVLIYASAAGLQRLLRLDSYKMLLNILCVLLVLYTMIIFKSSSEHVAWLMSGGAEFHHMFFVVLLPLVTLITALLRGYFRNGGPETADKPVQGGGKA